MRFWQRLVLWQIIGMVSGCSNVHPPPTSLHCDAGSIVFDGGMNTIDAGRNPDAGLLIPRLDGGAESLYRTQWGINAPLTQLVSEIFTEPSGWTTLNERLSTQGRGHLPPLQERYVSRFATLEDFTNSAAASFVSVGSSITTLRLPLVWHMWENDGDWPERMIATISTLQDFGWQLRPELLHNESYPADLDITDPNSAGWANPATKDRFIAYTNRAMNMLSGTLPRDSVVYLAVEPEGVLWNGYLNDEGKWPPGGTRAGIGLARAFLNLRDALIASAAIVKSYGFRTAVAVSVLPVLEGENLSGASLMKYLRSWWLADQLIKGSCNHNSEAFSPSCERTPLRSIDTLGITFYGGIRARRDVVSFGATENTSVELALADYDLQPNAVLFSQVLAEARERYRETLPESPVIEVAEFGFSESDVDSKIEKLIAYKKAMYCNNVRHAILHTLFFNTAEFSADDWNFGLIRKCDDDYECTLTDWGVRFVNEASYGPPPHWCEE